MQTSNSRERDKKKLRNLSDTRLVQLTKQLSQHLKSTITKQVESE